MHSFNSACAQPRLKLTQVASEWLPPSLPEGSTCVHICCIHVFVFLFLFAFMYLFSFFAFAFVHLSSICSHLSLYWLYCLILLFNLIFVTVSLYIFPLPQYFRINPVYTSQQILICIIFFAHDRSLSMKKVYKIPVLIGHNKQRKQTSFMSSIEHPLPIKKYSVTSVQTFRCVKFIYNLSNPLCPYKQ